MIILRALIIFSVAFLLSVPALAQENSVYVDKSSIDTTNLVYMKGSKFEIDYTFYNKYGTKCYYTFDKPLADDAKAWEKQEYYRRQANRDNWEITSQSTANERTVNRLTLEISSIGSEVRNPDFTGCQKYVYYRGDDEAWVVSFSGLVENEENIWMYPPNSQLFKILVINPYPYIKLNAEIGTEWEWSKEYPDNWGDRHWLEWPGKVEITSHYRIDRIEKITTQHYDDIECIVVESEANSRLGKSYLTSYFNEEIGFVKWDYTNIDSTKMVIEFNKLKK